MFLLCHVALCVFWVVVVVGMKIVYIYDLLIISAFGCVLWLVETNYQLFCAQGTSWVKVVMEIYYPCAMPIVCMCLVLWLWLRQAVLVSFVASRVCVCFMSGGWNGGRLLSGIVCSFSFLCVWLCALWVVVLMEKNTRALSAVPVSGCVLRFCGLNALVPC